MRAALAKGSAIISLIVCPTATRAEEPATTTQTNSLDAKFDEGQAIVGRGAPLSRAGAGITGSALQFNAEQGDTDVTLALNFDLNRSLPLRTAENDVFRLSSTNLVVSASTPINGQDGNFSLFSGDNLVTGSKLKFALTRMSSLLRDGRRAEPSILDTYRACIDTESSSWAAANLPSGPDQAKAYREDLAKRTVDAMNIRPVIRLDLQKPHGDLGKHIVTKCDVNDVQGLAAAYLPAAGTAVREGVFVDSPLHFMGVDASIGRNEYGVLDRTAFKTDKVSRNSWEIGAYYGLVFPGLTTSLRGRVVYGKKFQSPDEIQFCRTVTGSTNQECINGPDGLPKGTKTGLFSFEAKQVLALSENQKMAIAPQITYDFNKKGVGLEVPLYLSPDKDGKLSGGLKFAYSSKEDDFGIGLFVGVPFSIFFD